MAVKEAAKREALSPQQPKASEEVTKAGL